MYTTIMEIYHERFDKCDESALLDLYQCTGKITLYTIIPPFQFKYSLLQPMYVNVFDNI